METPASGARTLREGSPPHSGLVDVVQAEAEFRQLERSLSRQQHPSHQLARDLEKAEDEQLEKPFNLREYLSSANDANHEAGIKHKHVGVTWEDLEVKGFGGGDNKVNSSTLNHHKITDNGPKLEDIYSHFSWYARYHFACLLLASYW